MPHPASRLRSPLAAAVATLALLAVLTQPKRETAAPPVVAALELAAADTPSFTRALAPRQFELPADHGPHFEYQTEWWYYTGNLAAAGGARFGFQLTFFRRGLSPGPPPRGEGLATNQVYFAHLAVTDVNAGRHAGAERFSRGATALAGAEGEPFAVWLEDWRVEAAPSEGAARRPGENRADRPVPRWAVRVSARDAASGAYVDLELRAQKRLVAHGEDGLSRKSAETGNASYYLGYTRMSARGRVGLGPHQEDVSGLAWFDHEWSTSALGKEAVGWDWFSLQLDDGRELMLFQIRRQDGAIERVSEGTLVEVDGRARRLARDAFGIDPLGFWTSPASGARYPSGWRVTVPAEGLALAVQPLVADQEMRTTFQYWEGAVAVEGRARGRPVRGSGYVELTGYGASMQGVF